MLQHHLLLVDDDKDEATIFEEALSMLPFEHNITCTYVYDAEQAVDILDYIRPNYIFVDLNMPKMNGIDFLFLVKSKIDPVYTKIYLRSMMITDETIRLATVAGASGCIKKKNTIREITAELTAVLVSGSGTA